MICDPWDVVVVPFPFVDLPKSKRRPALVLSQHDFNRHGHTILAMITTKRQPAWPGDVAIDDRSAAGLPRPCIVRLKLFTLDNRLLADHLGRLGEADRTAVAAAFDTTLGRARQARGNVQARKPPA